MKFSVATPVFNGMPWLPCCLSSVADQRMAGVEVEHLVHDGGSTDGSLEVLEGAKNVQWKSEPDNGMYDAINRCWRQADADIVCYLNADEQFLPGGLQSVKQVFENNPRTQLLFGDALLIDEDASLISYRRIVKPSAAHTRIVHLGTMSCAMFFRRELLDAGMYFDTNWRAIGDAEWVYRAICRKTRIRASNKAVAAFSVTGGNLGSTSKALGEAAEWRNAAPAVLRSLAPVLKGVHWLKKLAAGAYQTRSVKTALYTPDSPKVRIQRSNPKTPSRWFG